MRRHQLGTTIVEFAICGFVLLLVIFACIEIARAMFVWNTIGEATRRGARIAAVCPIDNPDILEAAMFAPEGTGTSPILKDLAAGNIAVSYYTAGGAETTSYDDAAFVNVSVSDYAFTFVLPLIGGTITVPPFSTTVPVESLGYIPDTDDRGCPGA